MTSSSRYFEAYVTKAKAFYKSLVEDSAVPCTGIDDLIALAVSLAAFLMRRIPMPIISRRRRSHT